MSKQPVQKRFTILHSNDIHGDFQEEVVDGKPGKMIGGLARLSGYINKVRKEEKNVLYLIAGDMVCGSMIDTEFKGASTMELMNYLSPDAATIGNHELDYGLYHLLFLEKMANFPIVVSNLYIKNFHKRLMQPYVILNVDGFDILIIGIITEEIMSNLKMDADIGSFLSLEDASSEVGRICDTYKDDDIDLTILLTHVGFEADKKLAAMLKPEWGVDLMIGGHSHTILEQPEVVNNILITQAGIGTDQLGRFDILVDDDTNSIVDWKWELLPVDETLAEPDEKLQGFIDSFQDVVDRKYNTIITRFAKRLDHLVWGAESELGNLFADILAEHSKADIAFISSGSIRGGGLGETVTLGDFKKICPYSGALQVVTLTGAQIKSIFNFTLTAEKRKRLIFQISKGWEVTYEDGKGVVGMKFNGKEVEDTDQHSVCLQEYYYKNSERKMNIPKADLIANGTNNVATSFVEVIEEYLRNNQNLDREVEGRIVVKQAVMG
ncbi:MAG: bifunctional metallophosphatase/5'-nucleotidase [Chitinophagales bacterium]